MLKSAISVEMLKKEVAAAKEVKLAQLREFFTDHDATRSGGLNDEELTKMLTKSHPDGKTPDAEALAFIKRVVSCEGELKLVEMVDAIQAYSTYEQDKAQIDSVLAKYDKSKTGKLEREEARNMLTDISNADNVAGEKIVPATDDDVDLMMSMCDKSCNDSIDPEEIKCAVSFWKAHVDSVAPEPPKKSSMCTVM